MAKFWCLAVVIALCLVQSAEASCPEDQVIIRNGFLSGTECMLVPEGTLQYYMMGFVNGILMSPMWNASRSCLQPLADCLTRMSNVQLEAVMRKWLKENPERWHEGCHILAYSALQEMCQVRQP